MSDDRKSELGKTASGMQPNIAATLAYILTEVTGMIILIIEWKNRYIRFHAIQAILYGIVWTALWSIFALAAARLWSNWMDY